MDLEILRKNVKLLRTMNKISQEELADKIHLARSTYSAYEAGTKPFDLQTIDALSAVYNISLESLLNHDLSTGIFHRIYFQKGNQDIADLLNDFQSLSIPSKTFVIQKLDILFQHECSIYPEYNDPEIT